jgi:hypothetical protein
MALYEKFEPFVEGLALGQHNLSTAVFKFALCNAANIPNLVTYNELSDLTEILYTNMGGVNPTITTSGTTGRTGGTYDLVLDDYTITASGGAVAGFRYVVVYNSSSSTVTNQLICMFDYESDLVLLNGESLVVDFESNAGTDGSLFTFT